MKKKMHFIFVAMLSLFIAMLYGACQTSETAHVELKSELKVEHPLEGISNFAGKNVTLPSLKGKITVLDFWASWCGPCKEAFPYFDAMQRKLGKEKLQVIAVSLDDEPYAAIRFKDSLRPSFKTFWDSKGILAERFSVRALPTTLVLDSKGEIVHRHTGFDIRSHMILEEQIRSFMDELK